MTFDLRNLTLGSAFSPKVEDIPTPDFLTARGVPDDLLRLVGMSATARLLIATTFGTDEAENTARLVCATLRYRDAGGTDGQGTPVYFMSDAAALAEKDFDLLNALAQLVKPFLGLGAIATAVEHAKNGLARTSSSDGGTALPMSSDSPPSEPVSP